MSAVAFSRLAGTFFILIALVHVYRLVSPFAIQIGSAVVPHAAS